MTYEMTNTDGTSRVLHYRREASPVEPHDMQLAMCDKCWHEFRMQWGDDVTDDEYTVLVDQLFASIKK